MPYITNTDVEKRLGAAVFVQLTDDNGDGVADAAVVDEARLAAEGQIDGYLTRRYQLPIDVVTHAEAGNLLASLALDVVEYRLRSRRPPIPPEAVRKYADAVTWLTRLAEGDVDLPTITSVASSTVRGIVAAVRGEKRLLSREELADF